MKKKKNKKNKKRETSYSLIYETNSSNYVVISFQKSTDNLETRIKPRANLENRRWHHANSISTEINIPYIDILSLPDLFHVKSHLSFLFTPPCRKFICKYHLYIYTISSIYDINVSDGFARRNRKITFGGSPQSYILLYIWLFI